MRLSIKWTLRAFRFVAASMLLFAGVMKIISGHFDEFRWGKAVFWGMAVAEILLFCCIVSSRLWKLACYATMVLMACAAAWAAVSGERHCGCLGKIDLTVSGRIVYAGVLGTACWASIVLSGHRPRTFPAPE